MTGAAPSSGGARLAALVRSGLIRSRAVGLGLIGRVTGSEDAALAAARYHLIARLEGGRGRSAAADRASTLASRLCPPRSSGAVGTP